MIKAKQKESKREKVPSGTHIARCYEMIHIGTVTWEYLGEVKENLGNLKQQLKAAQLEVQTLADKFGVTSDQAREAAKRAAELKDRIGDAKALTDAFNPDAKFKGLAQALTGVTGGFAAVQGAMF